MKQELKVGEVYQTKDGYFFKIEKFMDKNSEQNKLNKTSAQVVHVQYCQNEKFTFALGKYFKLSVLKGMVQKAAR